MDAVALVPDDRCVTATPLPTADPALMAAYHQQALRHQREHGCGGFPFENGSRLAELVRAEDARRVLELGTAVGFSAFCLASASEQVRVDTIDRDPGHVALARANLERLGLAERVTVHEGEFASVLARLSGPFDLVFVDGFAADPGLLPQITALTGGVLVSANLSWSATTADYLDALARTGWQSSRERDIAISRRHSHVPR